MRAGLVIYDGLDSSSGGYLYDRKLVEYLRRCGDEVEIISIPRRKYARQLLDNFSPGLINKFKQAGFDLLLQDELNHPSLFALNRMFPHGLQGKWQKVNPAHASQSRVPLFPVIAIVHHLRSSEMFLFPQKRFYRFIESHYLAGVDGFIFNSRATKREVSRVGADLSNKPSLIAYPAGDNLKTNLTENEIKIRACAAGPLRLVFLGNIIPRKGLHTLLKALQTIPGDQYYLNVVGRTSVDIKYSREILQEIATGALDGSVTVHGYLDDEQVGQILRKSHVMVVPSSLEGFGIIYMEGMCFGLPAVGTTAGGAPEIITHGSDGYLVKPGDIQALQRHILELAQDRQKLLQMSLAAYRRCKLHSTWESTCESIREFLLRICKIG